MRLRSQSYLAYIVLAAAALAAVLITIRVFGSIGHALKAKLAGGTLPLAIATASLPNATVYQDYSATLQASGGTGTYSWSVASGRLPGGLTLSSSGVVGGTPNSAGSFSFVAKVDDRDGQSVTSWFTVLAQGPYGNVGDPYADEGGRPDGQAILVSRCHKLDSHKSYRLAQDVASRPDAVCFQLNGEHLRLDLNGHTITGRIINAGGDASGTVIFNGTVTCNFNDHGGDVGCIKITSSAPVSAGARIHHLTLHNGGNAGSRALHIDWPAPAPASGFSVRVFNLSGDTVAQPDVSRSYLLSIQGGGLTAEIAHNDLTCSGGANACQAIMCFGCHDAKMHDNRITMLPNTTSDTGRALLFDSADNGEAWNNLIYVNNNRGLRIRDSSNVTAHHNAFKNITGRAQDYVAAVHLGDPDRGTNDLHSVIENNTFEVDDGRVLMIRNGTNVVVRSNTVTCIKTCSGQLASVRSPLANGTTSISILSNPTASNLPAPQTVVEAGAVVTVCKSGAVIGPGAITRTVDCP